MGDSVTTRRVLQARSNPPSSPTREYHMTPAGTLRPRNPQGQLPELSWREPMGSIFSDVQERDAEQTVRLKRRAPVGGTLSAEPPLSPLQKLQAAQARAKADRPATIGGVIAWTHAMAAEVKAQRKEMVTQRKAAERDLLSRSIAREARVRDEIAAERAAAREGEEARQAELRQERERAAATRARLHEQARGDIAKREQERAKAARSAFRAAQELLSTDMARRTDDYVQYVSLKRDKQRFEQQQLDSELRHRRRQQRRTRGQELSADRLELDNTLRAGELCDAHARRRREEAASVQQYLLWQRGEQQRRQAAERNWERDVPPLSASVPGGRSELESPGPAGSQRREPQCTGPMYHRIPLTYVDHRGKLLYRWGTAG
eukprot:TRINITY_DN1319_c0_g1_i1.p1 TRINITY_DN1319_c0_g1~~TRINITY_DN1319_c0_g1_i1.p1  ORF type:complete len:376 (+),score=135.05 TRINITY_DN1319_c0_g1_i1:80-1207(+)